jgi:hypothetical protein
VNETRTAAWSLATNRGDASRCAAGLRGLWCRVHGRSPASSRPPGRTAADVVARSSLAPYPPPRSCQQRE